VLEKAITLDPNFGPALNQLGYAYADTGDFRKAEATFERYISANPGDPNPVDSLAELYLRMGQLDKAESKYKEALDLKSDFTGSCSGLAYISALRENYGPTTRWLEEFLARSTPTQKMEGLWLVHFYDYLQGRLERSLAGYLSLRKIGESYHSTFFVAVVGRILGCIYCDLGRFEQARREFGSYFEYDRSNATDEADLESAMARNAFNLGWTNLKQGRLEAAREQLAKIKSYLADLKDSSEFPWVVFRYQLLDAEIALAGGTTEAAVAAAEKMHLMNFPGMGTANIASYNIPFFKDALARALWKKGDFDRAAAEYRKLMTVDPRNQLRYLIHPLYHYRLGRVLEEKGDRAEAAQEYRKFLEYWKDADGSHPEPGDARQRLAALKGN